MRYPMKNSNTSEISTTWLLAQISRPRMTFYIGSCSESFGALGAVPRVETLEIEISDARWYFQQFVAKPSKWRIFTLLINLEIFGLEMRFRGDHEWSKHTQDTLLWAFRVPDCIGLLDRRTLLISWTKRICVLLKLTQPALQKFLSVKIFEKSDSWQYFASISYTLFVQMATGNEMKLHSEIV